MSKPNSKNTNRKRLKRKLKKKKNRRGDYDNQYCRSYAQDTGSVMDQIATLQDLDRLMTGGRR